MPNLRDSSGIGLVSMFECKFCGHSSENPRAKFCPECGPQGPAVGWELDEVDTFESLLKYTEIVSSLPTLAGGATLDDRTATMRVKFKISYAAHRFIAERLHGGQSRPAISEQLSVFYNANFTEAYAGHDTFIEFKFDNKTEDRFFKARLEWDDLETEDRIDLQASIDRFIVPGESRQIGTTVIFDRAGLKELVGLRLDLIDEAGGTNSYELHPLRVRVTNPAVNIHNSYTQSNSISIEGRGVVDAQGLGATAEQSNNKFEGDRWVELMLTPLVDSAEIAGDTLKFINSKIPPLVDTQEAQPVESEETLQPISTNQEALENKEVDVQQAPFDFSSISISLQGSAESAVSSLVLDTPTNAAAFDIECETLCEPGTFIRRNLTPILKVIYGDQSKTLTSPTDGIFQFINEIKSGHLAEKWSASVTIIALDQLEIRALLLEDTLVIDDIPYGMEATLASIQASIPETGVVGTGYCSDFDKELNIVLHGASALVGVALETPLDVGETILGSPDVRDENDEQGTRIAKVHRHQYLFECALLKDYLATDSVEIVTVHADHKRISSPGETLFFVKASGVQYSVISRFPAKLSSVIDRAKPERLEISVFCAASEVQSLLTVKNPHNGTAFLSLSECDSVEDHYIDIISLAGNPEDFSFRYLADVDSAVVIDGVIAEIETDNVMLELVPHQDGILGYVRPSGLKTRNDHTLIYEVISAGPSIVGHRYHYRCADQSSIEEPEQVSVGQALAENVDESEITTIPPRNSNRRRWILGFLILALVSLALFGPSENKYESDSLSESERRIAEESLRKKINSIVESDKKNLQQSDGDLSTGLSPQELVDKAKELNNANKPAQAERLFSKAAIEYDDSIAWAWLGFYAEQGTLGNEDPIQAIEYYRRSMLADPEYQWVRDQLRALSHTIPYAVLEGFIDSFLWLESKYGVDFFHDPIAEALSYNLPLEYTRKLEQYYVGKHALRVNRINNANSVGTAEITQSDGRLTLLGKVQSNSQQSSITWGEDHKFYIGGVVYPISDTKFVLEGGIKGTPNKEYAGEPYRLYKTKGRFLFEATKNRKYWRLYEVNGERCVCDDGCGNEFCYIDIGFSESGFY